MGIIIIENENKSIITNPACFPKTVDYWTSLQ